VVHVDGRQPAEATQNVIRDDDGVFFGRSGFVKDVSERVRVSH
jgi:hypothetical protein